MTADPRDMAMRGHRILCALAMAALMYRHAQLMAAKGFCTGRPHHDQMDLTAYMLAGTGALLLSGALLTFAMLPGRNGRPGSLPKRIAAFEPALLGLGLVLMATCSGRRSMSDTDVVASVPFGATAGVREG